MYIYQADVYCDKCGEQICDSLRRKAEYLKTLPADLRGTWELPSDPDDEGTYDSDDYPKGPFDDSEEADTPQHCAECGVFLENSLTDDGVEYVIDSALENPGQESEVVQEWINFYDLNYESEPYFDRLDICEAYYLFASLYHGGQWSKEYEIFGRLERMHYRPGCNGVSYRNMSENARGIFIRLASKAGRRHP